MKFDLISALNIVNSAFGTAGEITAAQTPAGVAITISTVHRGEIFRNRVAIPQRAIDLEPNINTSNLMVRVAVEELEKTIQHSDANRYKPLR